MRNPFVLAMIAVIKPEAVKVIAVTRIDVRLWSRCFTETNLKRNSPIAIIDMKEVEMPMSKAIGLIFRIILIAFFICITRS